MPALNNGGKRMFVTKSYDHPKMGDDSRDKFFFSDFRAVKDLFEPNRLCHKYSNRQCVDIETKFDT